MLLTDKPSNVTINARHDSYQIGDQLICSADGNPSPAIQWKNLLTGEITNERKLVVAKDFEEKQINFFQCIATNYIGDVLMTADTNVSFTIVNNSKTINLLLVCRLYYKTVVGYCFSFMT